MTWKKLGRVFYPCGQRPWMQSHAAVPVPLRLDRDRYRVYFGTRDRDNHPRAGYVEFDIQSPQKILRISEDFVLGRGPRGFFDHNGVYPGPIIAHNHQLLMYYIGRINGEPPLYYMSIGLASSRDGGETFHRELRAPLMGRSEYDPWMTSTPFILVEDGLWRMWYLSGLRWDTSPHGAHSYYHIKYAESADGRNWKREGRVCVELRESEQETNIASPTVIKENGLYRMWYSSVAGSGYRIGYAESDDGYSWTRKDDAVGIDVSPSGWDSEAMAYPNVFRHEGRNYMLYSGNGCGRAGFGLAVESTGGVDE